MVSNRVEKLGITNGWVHRDGLMPADDSVVRNKTIACKMGACMYDFANAPDNYDFYILVP